MKRKLDELKNMIEQYSCIEQFCNNEYIYDFFKKIISKKEGNRFIWLCTLDELEAAIDYKFDLEEWLYAYVHYLKDMKKYDKAERVCTELIEYFSWNCLSQYKLNSLLVSMFIEQGKKNECLFYSKCLYEKNRREEEHIALYLKVLIAYEQFEKAKVIFNQHYNLEKIQCNMQNLPILNLYVELLSKTGDYEAEHKLRKKIQEYLNNAQKVVNLIEV